MNQYVNEYMKDHVFTSITSTGILRTHKVTSSQMAQLVEHCTGIADVMGSNPVQA